MKCLHANSSPVNPASGDATCHPEDRSKDARIAATWKQEWEASGPTRVHHQVSDPGEGVKGEDLSRKHWTTLNRLLTGVGRYKASMKKWGLASECGEPEYTADHIINSGPPRRPPSEAGIFELGQSIQFCNFYLQAHCLHTKVSEWNTPSDGN